MGDFVTSASHQALNNIERQTVPDCSPELSLLRTIARVELAHAEENLLHELLGATLDWQYLLELAAWHAVEPLLFLHLNQHGEGIVAPEIMHRLRERCRGIAGWNLILASKLQSISTHLRSREIEHISFKGPLLAQACYGNLALRESRDLDILVPPSKLAAARDALVEIGFTDKYGFSMAQQAASFRWGFEHSFTAAGGLEVELHWHVVPRFISSSLDMPGMWQRAITARMFDCQVPTFCPEDLLVALCLHSGKHGWAHLSHFCDMAQFLLNNPSLDWGIVGSHLGDSNTTRNVYVSLYLLHQHWYAAIPEDLQAVISTDPHVVRLAHRVESEIWPSPDPVLQQSNLRWLLQRSSGEALRDRLRFIIGVAFSPTTGDFQEFNLPGMLAPLYPGLRLWRVACDYGSSKVVANTH